MGKVKAGITHTVIDLPIVQTCIFSGVTTIICSLKVMFALMNTKEKIVQ
tara:strand:- start:10 stop:156 length:147 start_codon:yes stop_codon:yes gene_type:complete